MSGAAVKEKVQRILTDRLEDVRLQGDGFRIPYESAFVDVSVIEQEARTLVYLASPVLREIAGTTELFKWIATEGAMSYFGSFGFLENSEKPGEGVLLLDHTLLGDYLDPEELFQAVAALATTANTKDDELQQRFGGKRTIDPS